MVSDVYLMPRDSFNWDGLEDEVFKEEVDQFKNTMMRPICHSSPNFTILNKPETIK